MPLQFLYFMIYKKEAVLTPLGPQQQSTHVFQASVNHWYDVKMISQEQWHNGRTCLTSSLSVRLNLWLQLMAHGFNLHGVLVPAKCERVIGLKCCVESLREGWAMIGLGGQAKSLLLSLRYRVECPVWEVPPLGHRARVFESDFT